MPSGLTTSSAAPVSDWLRMRQAIVRPLNSMLPDFNRFIPTRQYLLTLSQFERIRIVANITDDMKTMKRMVSKSSAIVGACRAEPSCAGPPRTFPSSLYEQNWDLIRLI